MKETLKLVLEPLENSIYLVSNEARKAESLYGKYPSRLAMIQGLVAAEVAHKQAITAIKEDLAQPEQEPVAYGMRDTMIGCGNRMMYVRLDKGQDGCTVPLYTTPQQRPKVVFPTMLRKMWSGGEVQAWLDETVNKENT